MKKATALLIKNRYPENIQVSGIEDPDTGKCKVSVFLMKDKRVVSLLLESPYVFSSTFVAEQHGRSLCQSIIDDKTLQ